jgi:hypothetical protein
MRDFYIPNNVGGVGSKQKQVGETSTGCGLGRQAPNEDSQTRSLGSVKKSKVKC